MLFLPEQADAVEQEWEKISTNMALSKMGCPVYKSAVIRPDETIDHRLVYELSSYFKSDEVMVRYQYICPNSHPVQTGNRYTLTPEALSKIQSPDAVLWVTKPINRLENEYGINLLFYSEQCTMEIVGKGFDASDLTRGRISPQQIITTELPVRMGLYGEWWKFLHFQFQSKSEYLISQERRLQKLREMGYEVSHNIFEPHYHPLPMDKLEELLLYTSKIYHSMKSDNYCVSSSIYEGHFVFWDIQTPDNKMRRYGI